MSAEEQLKVILRAQAAWFATAAFPSMLLVYDAEACVSFQGIDSRVDFTAIQILFVASSLPLFATSVISRAWFVRYQRIVTTVNAMVQLGAVIVHTRGLTSGGAGLHTRCFQVDFGGVWYTAAVNLVGLIIFCAQLLILTRLGSAATTRTSSAARERRSPIRRRHGPRELPHDRGRFRP